MTRRSRLRLASLARVKRSWKVNKRTWICYWFLTRGICLVFKKLIFIGELTAFLQGKTVQWECEYRNSSTGHKWILDVFISKVHTIQNIDFLKTDLLSTIGNQDEHEYLSYSLSLQYYYYCYWDLSPSLLQNDFLWYLILPWPFWHEQLPDYNHFFIICDIVTALFPTADPCSQSSNQFRIPKFYMNYY